MSFLSWWTALMGLLPLPESAPSDMQLLLWDSLPMAILTLTITLLWPTTWGAIVTALAILTIASVVRYSPWFHRPEGYHLNAVVGGIAGMIVHVLLRKGW